MNNEQMIEFIEELERYIEDMSFAYDDYTCVDRDDNYLTDY